ncbi:hypothetical protein RSOLAG1IB_08631 [Rhizoctonia solani AG-1 IB]|uniref:Uncharacterized protein n=1 Tax=Thanatephorus cucumeris (strain AG1-IB / isolate 7/3/14) TaxID=1108050 RepID=A0A0B7FKU5_THACB|nr:hypothetical protein RSOLAG1IB_08631 [Rhizoctonia solani AG-1 IB]
MTCPLSTPQSREAEEAVRPVVREGICWGLPHDLEFGLGWRRAGDVATRAMSLPMYRCKVNRKANGVDSESTYLRNSLLNFRLQLLHIL